MSDWNEHELLHCFLQHLALMAKIEQHAYEVVCDSKCYGMINI